MKKLIRSLKHTQESPAAPRQSDGLAQEYGALVMGQAAPERSIHEDQQAAVRRNLARRYELQLMDSRGERLGARAHWFGESILKAVGLRQPSSPPTREQVHDLARKAWYHNVRKVMHPDYVSPQSVARRVAAVATRLRSHKTPVLNKSK